MASIFTKIINREIPAYILAEDERYIAFLDINPLVLGHALVVPKKEVDFIFDLDDDTLGGITVFAKKVAHAIKKAVPCRRVGVAVVGLEVPHVHVHLIPMTTMNDINFTRPKLTPSSAELTQVADAILKAIK
ncbi:HIT family protein [Chryseolinea soli]|uniref:HIT family protein n=1 Tax=Chryseolinea soli TaxID=2321403 RepID=A0A385SMV1_9BACT|nr:HIT family protein [Chryseolinea soli]AYB32324.1 HIT family protein [Chryseolinea soli]